MEVDGVMESQEVREPYNFEREYEDLLRRKPAIAGFKECKLSALPVDHPMRDLRNVEAYIEKSWADTYKDEKNKPIDRFCYSAGYLQWLLSSPPGVHDRIHVIINPSNNDIIGLAYGVPRNIRSDNSTFQTVIATGLSVSPAYKGIGVAQLMNVHSKNIIFRQNGNNPYFAWWDDALNRNGHSLEIFRQHDPTFDFIGKFPLLAKFFDFETAFSVLALPYYQKALMRIMFRGRKDGKSLVKPMSETEAEKFYDIFLRAPNEKKAIERRWSKEGFVKEATFKNPYDGDPFKPMYFAFYKNSDIVGGILGYRIPVTQVKRADFMFTDHLFYRDALSMAERKGFLQSTETIAKEQYGVFGSLYLGGFDNSEVFKSLNHLPTFPRVRSLVMGLSSPSGLSRIFKPGDVFIDHH